MRFPPITVTHGQNVLFQQFSDGNVIMPMDNAERAIVASTLREILDMVDGDVTLPSFSMGTDASCSLQTESGSDAHRFCADLPQAGLRGNQISHYSARPVRQHPNDN